MKEFFKKYPKTSKILTGLVVVGILWGVVSYEFYAMKRDAYIAGCMAGSNGRMGSFQCWSVYHAAGYN